MGIFSRKKVIAGSASGYSAGGPVANQNLISQRGLGWQKRVLDLVGVVPEASGAGALVENSLDRVVLRVEGVEGAQKELLESLLASFPLGRAGMLIWYVGEFFPVFRFGQDSVEWEVLSPMEFRPPSKSQLEAKMLVGDSGRGDGKWEDVRGKWFRVWKEAPGRRFWAWSVHRALIDLLESMYLHQHADTAIAMSRLAGAGILWWPSNLPRLGLRDGVPEQGSQEELQMMLQNAMQQSIADRGKSEAFVPIVVFADPMGGDESAPKHVLMERPDDAAGYKERMEAYRTRYATSVELPVESVSGVGAANHWTAWVVKEDKWRFYLSPLAELIADSLQRNFLIPVAKKLEIENAEDLRIVVDGEALIAKPDKTDAGIRMYQLGGISGEAAREATGFDPVDDAPDPLERLNMEAIRKASPRVQELPVDARDTRPNG